MSARDWQSRRGGHGGDGIWGNANDFSDRLLCSCWCRGLWLCREGKASLSQQEISSIQAWPGLPLHGPAHRSFSSKRRLFKQRRGHVLSKMTKQHFLLSHPKTNWPKSAVRQLADGEVRCIRPKWEFSSWWLFSFFFFFFVLPAACHLLQCVIVS